MNWQPIETAPRDGTEILVEDAEGRRLTCWRCGDDWLLRTQDGRPIVIVGAIKWTILPDPSAQEKAR